MAERTVQILPGGQSSAPFTYTLPPSQAFMLMAVRAVFDGTASGAFLPCVQLVSDAGVVMAETIGTSVAAGGSADVSFFPLRRGTSGAVTGYSATVYAVGTPNTLVAYYRLGETSGDFLDTSNYPPTPYNLLIDGTGSNTRGVTGCLAPDQDDRAWQVNVKGNPMPGYVRATGDPLNPHTFPDPTPTAWTIVGWVRPSATVGGDPSWRGSVWSMNGIIAGSPSYELGVGLELYYAGGATPAIARVTRANDSFHGGLVTADSSGLAAGTNYMLGGTYDGTTLSLYVNGTLVSAVADAPRSVAFAGAYAAGYGPFGNLYGVVDEVAIWKSVLPASDMARLFLAGTS